MSGPIRTAMILFATCSPLHPGIKPLGDDVGQAIVDGELDFDMGISRPRNLWL
jgi:hypothetical protein